MQFVRVKLVANMLFSVYFKLNVLHYMTALIDQKVK